MVVVDIPYTHTKKRIKERSRLERKKERDRTVKKERKQKKLSGYNAVNYTIYMMLVIVII